MPFIATVALSVCVLIATLFAIEVHNTVVPPWHGQATRRNSRNFWSDGRWLAETLSAKLLQALAFTGVMSVLPVLIELPPNWLFSGLPAQVLSGVGLAAALLHRRDLDCPRNFWA